MDIPIVYGSLDALISHNRVVDVAKTAGISDVEILVQRGQP